MENFLSPLNDVSLKVFFYLKSYHVIGSTFFYLTSSFFCLKIKDFVKKKLQSKIKLHTAVLNFVLILTNFPNSVILRIQLEIKPSMKAKIVQINYYLQLILSFDL